MFSFRDHIDGEYAYTEGFMVVISRFYWGRLTRPEKVALVLHELRHVWQNMGLVVLWISTILLAWTLTLEVAVALPLAALVVRWMYVGVRAHFSVEWAEMDAVRFSFRLTREGTVSLMKRSGIWGTDHPDYHRAYSWVRDRYPHIRYT